jgi:hypothetical protein
MEEITSLTPEELKSLMNNYQAQILALTKVVVDAANNTEYHDSIDYKGWKKQMIKILK